MDWITLLGIVLGFAAGWLVWWRLKPQGAIRLGYIFNSPPARWGKPSAKPRRCEMNPAGDFMVTLK